MITTDDRHPLRSRSINQNAVNCMTINFRYTAQLGGGGGGGGGWCGKPTAHAHVMMRLTCRSSGMLSEKTMELSEDVCRCRNCSKARPRVSR